MVNLKLEIKKALSAVQEEGKVLIKSNTEDYSAEDLYEGIRTKLDKLNTKYFTFEISPNRILIELDIEEE